MWPKLGCSQPGVFEAGYRGGFELVICLSGLLHGGTAECSQAQLTLATLLCIDRFEDVLETLEAIHMTHVGVNVPIKVSKH